MTGADTGKANTTGSGTSERRLARRGTRFGLGVAAALGLGLALGLANVSRAQADLDAEPDPEALALLQAVAGHVGEAEQVSVRIETHTVIHGMGQQHDDRGVLEMAIDRPQQLALRHDEGGHQQMVIVDGNHYYEHTTATNRYTRNAAPPSIDALFDADPTAGAQDATLLAHLRPLLQPLVTQRGFEHFHENFLVEAEDHGEVALDGEPHRRLRLLIGDKYHAHDHLHWELPIDVWLTTDEQPLPRRLTFDLGAMGGDGPGQATEARIDAEFHDWRINDGFGEAEDAAEGEASSPFAFTPPADAEESDALFDMAAASGGQFEDLLGEPAPEFELPLLEGGSMSLAEHTAEEEIVILDFWATWCGPCIEAMPELLGVQADYADEDVVFYAINLREPAEQVSRFIDQQGWEDLQVPMDSDGSIAREYEVVGIPQTVIIGPDGTVQAVHRGFTRDLRQRLGGELDELLAGGSLAD